MWQDRNMILKAFPSMTWLDVIARADMVDVGATTICAEVPDDIEYDDYV